MLSLANNQKSKKNWVTRRRIRNDSWRYCWAPRVCVYTKEFVIANESFGMLGVSSALPEFHHLKLQGGRALHTATDTQTAVVVGPRCRYDQMINGPHQNSFAIATHRKSENCVPTHTATHTHTRITRIAFYLHFICSGQWTFVSFFFGCFVSMPTTRRVDQRTKAQLNRLIAIYAGDGGGGVRGRAKRKFFFSSLSLLLLFKTISRLQSRPRWFSLLSQG